MNRSGFTLFEMLLALLLASVLTVLLAAAIDIHLRVVDAGRANVEEAQLARALLNRIADDLRSAVHYEPIDTSETAAETGISGGTSTTSSGQPGSGAPEGSGSPGASGVGEPPAGDEMAEDPTSNVATSAVPPSVPGLYGNQYELQVDVSHLPRLDQYESLLEAADGSTPVDVVSDVKTVAYYVIDTQQNSSAFGTAGVENGGGLVRRELDRAVTAWAAEQGQVLTADQDQEPIAPEVTAIEFRYFDGTEVLDEWDSAARGGLPVAVEIAIAIRPTPISGTWFSSRRSSSQSGSAEEREPLVYSLLVHLPTAEPTSGEATYDTMDGLSEMTDLGTSQ